MFVVLYDCFFLVIRIVSNRQAARRSRLKKIAYIEELENAVKSYKVIRTNQFYIFFPIHAYMIYVFICLIVGDKIILLPLKRIFHQAKRSLMKN